MRYYLVLEEKDIVDLIMDIFPEVKEEDIQIKVVDGKVEITIPETDRQNNLSKETIKFPC